MLQIVVLQRGWVVMGDVTELGHELQINNGAVIRRWGTTQGLGELAESGPLSETILDPVHRPMHVHILTTILRIDCNEAAWAKPETPPRRRR